MESWHLIVFKTQGCMLIIFNLSLVLLITSKRRLRKKYCNQVLVNLFLSHIFEGVVALLRSTILYSKPRDPYKVSLSVHLFTASTILSYLATIPVTCDRLLAIKWPYHYQRLTSAHIYVVNIVVWSLTALYTILAMTLNFNSRIGDITTMSMTLFMYIFSIIANFMIYQIVRIQTEHMKQNCVVKKRSNSSVNNNRLRSDNTTNIKDIMGDSTTLETCKPNRSVVVDQLIKQSSSDGLAFPFYIPIGHHQRKNTNKQAFPGYHNKPPLSATVDQEKQASQPPETYMKHPTSSKSNPNQLKSKKKMYNCGKLVLDKRCLRSAYICTGIVVSFMICWTPHALHDLLKVTDAAPSIVYSDSVLARLTIIIAFCNGIIDPIIYVLLNKDLKFQLKKMTFLRNEVVSDE